MTSAAVQIPEREGLEEEAPRSVDRSRAHEVAFRRWSVPASEEVEVIAPGMASFRIYTPAELKGLPLRPSHRAAPPRPTIADELVEVVDRAKAVGPAALVPYLLMGIAAGMILLSAIVLLGNLTDDTRAASTRLGRSATVVRFDEPKPAPVARAETKPIAVSSFLPPVPAAVVHVAQAATIELADEAPPVAIRRTVAKKKNPPIVREAPF